MLLNARLMPPLWATSKVLCEPSLAEDNSFGRINLFTFHCLLQSSSSYIIGNQGRGEARQQGGQ